MWFRAQLLVGKMIKFLNFIHLQQTKVKTPQTLQKLLTASRLFGAAVSVLWNSRQTWFNRTWRKFSSVLIPHLTSLKVIPLKDACGEQPAQFRSVITKSGLEVGFLDGLIHCSWATKEVERSRRTRLIKRSGYLMKRGGKRKNWKRRWFVLRQRDLAYYENEPHGVTKRPSFIL